MQLLDKIMVDYETPQTPADAQNARRNPTIEISLEKGRIEIGRRRKYLPDVLQTIFCQIASICCTHFACPLTLPFVMTLLLSFSALYFAISFFTL